MAFFEMTDQSAVVRPCYAEVQRWIDEVGIERLNARLKEAETIFRRIGITFAVYGEGVIRKGSSRSIFCRGFSRARSGARSIAASGSARRRSTPSSTMSITAARSSAPGSCRASWSTATARSFPK